MQPGRDPTREHGHRLYVDRRDTVQTHEQMVEEGRARVDAESDGGLWGALEAVVGQVRLGAEVNSRLATQAHMLAQGAQVRPAPPMPNSYYLAVDHPQLQAMVTEGVDPDAVGQMGAMWKETGNELIEFQEEMVAVINSSQENWAGAAGDQARQFMADTANWIGNAGSSAQLAGTQTELQAEALATAKNAMPEPVDFDVNAANEQLQRIQDPIALVEQSSRDQQAFAEQKAAHQEAVRVMSSYDGSLGGATTMPAFAAPPTMGGGTPPPPPPPGGVDPGGANPGGVNPGGGSIVGGGGRGSSGPRGAEFAGTRPAAGSAPSGAPVPRTSPAPVGRSGGNQGPGGVPLGPVGPGLPGAVPGGAGGRGVIPGGRGFGPGSGGRGGFGPIGSGGAGGSGAGQGGGPRTGAGMGGAEPAAGRGASSAGGPGGRGGASSMGGMGAGSGRGQGGEDDEHKRPSFLVEPDPDEIFGTDQMTAPSVIE